MKRLTILLGEDTVQLYKVMDLEFESNGECYYYYFPENGKSQKQQENEAYELIDECKMRPIVVCTHSEIIFTVIRLAIYKKLIKFNEVEIRWYKDGVPFIILNVDENGRVENWPSELFETSNRLLGELLIPLLNGLV